MKVGYKQTVIIGICAGIAGYKIIDLIRILKSKNILVEVIMTRNAVKMFGKELFEKESGRSVLTDLMEDDFDYRQVLEKRQVEHIKVADCADIFVIAPATANIIGKIANGIADDLLTTVLMAAEAPVLLCPSMNVHMWNNPVFQENLHNLKRLGFYIVPPDKGKLACGYEGVGRLADVQNIASEISQLLYKKNSLKGKKIMVTAGGTSEPIDAVRTVTNRASGKMGVAIAEECCLRGAKVLLLKSVTATAAGRHKDTSMIMETFETSSDLEQLIKKHAKNYDVIFHTAAVSDFIPEKLADKKIDSRKSFSLAMKKTPKILHKIKSWHPKIIQIGFKAVYKENEDNLIRIGIEKLKVSRSDYIAVNDVGREGIGFGADDNEVYIISREGFVEKIPRRSKSEIARRLVEVIFSLD